MISITLDSDVRMSVTLRRIGLILIGTAAGGITGCFMGWEGYFRSAILFLCTLDMLAALEQFRIRRVWIWTVGGVIAGLLGGGAILFFELDRSSMLGDGEEWGTFLFYTTYYSTGILLGYRIFQGHVWRQFLSIVAVIWMGYLGFLLWDTGGDEASILLLVIGLSFLNALVFAIFWYTFARVISDAADHRIRLKMFRKLMNKEKDHAENR